MFRDLENMDLWLRDPTLKEALWAWGAEVSEMEMRFFYRDGNTNFVEPVEADSCKDGWFLTRIGESADSILCHALRDRIEGEEECNFHPLSAVRIEDLAEVVSGIHWLANVRLRAEDIGLPEQWGCSVLSKPGTYPIWMEEELLWTSWQNMVDAVSSLDVIANVPSDLWKMIARGKFAALVRDSIKNLELFDKVLSRNSIVDFMMVTDFLANFGMSIAEYLIRLNYWGKGVIGALDQTVLDWREGQTVRRTVPDGDLSTRAHGREKLFCGTAFTGFDASEYVKYLLLEEYGFECGFGEFTLVRFVDDEHYLTVNLPGCSIYSGPMGFCEVEFGIGRRDIGELMSLLGFDISGVPVETVLWESAIAPFGGRDRFKFRNCEVTRSELKALVEQMMGKVEHCANISYLEEYVEFKPTLGTSYEKTRHLAAVLPVKICNSLLNGWDSVADLPALNRFEELYRSISDAEEWQTHIDRVLERVHKWRAKFPNGVERNLYETETKKQDSDISVHALEGAVRAGGCCEVRASSLCREVERSHGG